MSRSPSRLPPVRPAGYPTGLEGCAALLALGQIAMSWLALDRLPSTVVPYGPTGSLLGLPGAGYEAEVWTWTVLALWAASLGISLAFHRLAGTSPLPVLSVALFATLAVLRAGVIGLNLDPALGQATVLVRAAVAGLAALLLAAGAESWRTRRRLRHAAAHPASYEEPTPRGALYWAMAACILPYVMLPTRVRVIDAGLVVVTPVSYLFVPRRSIAEAEPMGRLAALLGGGLNLATSPGSAVRIRVRGRLLPLVISVVDRDRFLGALAHSPEDH